MNKLTFLFWPTGGWVGSFCLAGLLMAAPSRAAEVQNGVAVAIVYDTSGSMLQKVRDADGRMSPKHVIARKSLHSVLERLEAATHSPGGGPIHAGLVIFDGNRAVQAVKLGPLTAGAMERWLDAHGQPRAGTPLGEGVRMAGQAVLQSGLPRKHVLVITDGINTRGPDPTAIMPQLQSRAERTKAALSFHFVAFDVKAAEFAGVQKLGATVVGAEDEKQLNSQLDFIISKKILLEDEEPPSAKPQTK